MLILQRCDVPYGSKTFYVMLAALLFRLPDIPIGNAQTTTQS